MLKLTKELINFIFTYLTAIIFFSIYLAKCDTDYSKKCSRSVDYCFGYVQGEVYSQIAQGFSKAQEDTYLNWVESEKDDKITQGEKFIKPSKN